MTMKKVWVVTGGGMCSCHLLSRDASNHPSVYRTALLTKNHLVQILMLRLRCPVLGTNIYILKLPDYIEITLKHIFLKKSHHNVNFMIPMNTSFIDLSCSTFYNF